MRNLIGVLTAATLLAGCTAYSMSDPLQTSGSLLKSEGSVTVKTIVIPGGYTTPEPPAGYRVAAVVPNLTKAQVDHVTLRFFSMEGETETPLSNADGSARVETANLAEAEAGLQISGLKLGKTYRVKATAYRAAEGTSTPISAEVAADFKLDKAEAATQLEIPLHDVPFSGAATASGIVITPSNETSHEGPIEFEAGPSRAG